MDRGIFWRRTRMIAIVLVACTSSSLCGGTVWITRETTNSSEFPAAIANAVLSLAKAEGEQHRIILDGNFKLEQGIRLSWRSESKLTLLGDVVLDGSKIPESQPTLFIAGRNISMDGIAFQKCTGHAVVVGGKSERYAIRNCTFTDCRQSAIHVWNDPHTILPEQVRRGTISGNQIERFNLANAKWSNDAIAVFDQGVVIERNRISDSDTETNGIRAMGRDLLVRHNVIRDVGREDSGGIYLWGGPHASLFRGNIVRGNLVVGTSRGIYLDDGTSGAVVEENVVKRSKVCGIFISGGRDNLVRKNVVEDAPVFLHIDSRCLGWDSRPDFANSVDESRQRLNEALANPLQAKQLKQRYPEFRSTEYRRISAKRFGSPESNRVMNNFVCKVDETWELMNFSRSVKADFRSLNQIQEPEIFDSDRDLERGDLKKRFGFESWEIANERK